MTSSPSATVVWLVNLLGRVLYRLALTIAIVWVIGLIVSLFVDAGSSGGAREIP